MKKNEIPTPHPNHQEASAAITAALGTIAFPADKSVVVSKVGDWKVPYAKGVNVPLGQIFEAVPVERFYDAGQAVRAVDAHWGRVAELLQGAYDYEEQQQKAKAHKKHHTE